MINGYCRGFIAYVTESGLYVTPRGPWAPIHCQPHFSSPASIASDFHISHVFISNGTDQKTRGREGMRLCCHVKNMASTDTVVVGILQLEFHLF